MFDLQPSEPSSSKRRTLVLVIAAVAFVVAGILGGRALRDRLRQPPSAPVVAEAPAPKPAPPPPAAEPAPPEPDPVSAPRPRRPRPKAPPPAPVEPAAPTTGTLRFEADVEGAIAFIDRQFVGNVPVTVEDIAPGTHVINVSAPGYDGHSETVEVKPGPRNVVVRFREVRLGESIEVVHKHGIGSCQGRLVADLDGIRYETTNQGHAFSAPLADIETLEVNYLDKNLKLRLRGGRTYNFTNKAANADALYVFQRNVEKARDRLAKGDPPAKR